VLYSAVRFAETIDAATGGRIKIEVGRRAGALRNGGSRGSSYRAEIVIDRRAGERTEKFPPPQCPTPGIETARL
jgi:hypothetical protein